METFYSRFLTHKSLRLYTERRLWPFEELCSLTNKVEKELVAAGVKSGEILAVQAPNHPLHLALFLTCEKLGLILAPFFAGLTEQGYKTQLDRLLPEWVLSVKNSALSIQPYRKSSIRKSQSGCLFQTSGTTGEAGFVYKSFENLWQNAQLTVRGQNFTEDSNIGCILSFSHVGGLCMQTTGGLIAGSQLTLLDRYQMQQFAIQLKKFTHTIIVPSYFHLLKNEKHFAETRYNHRPLIVTGSTVVSEKVFEELKNKNFQVQSVYGLTEIGPYVCVLQDDYRPVENALSCLGTPLPDYRMRINQEKENEIEVSGPCLGEKYFPQTEEFAPLSNKEGFLARGDQGYQQDGLFYFTGRLKNLIFVGGFKVNASEIEEKIMSLPYVQKCLVLPQPNSILGEVPVAFVVGDSTQIQSLLQYLKSQLPSHKVPRRIHFVDVLPETSIGKNNPHALKRSLK